MTGLASATKAGAAKRLAPQRKPALELRPAGDRFEREADWAADAVLNRRTSFIGAPSMSQVPSSQAQLLDDERGNGAHRSPPPTAPASVSDALHSSGSPLAATTRNEMEQQFRSDFGQVRIHTDPRAAASASAIDALAYTSGANIVFANGAYDPRSRRGRHLLAHELAHVVQQRGTTAPPAVVQRRNIFEDIGIFLGLVEGNFSDLELAAYLDKVTKTGKIEDSYDSDNKARAIVRGWKAGNAAFKLDPAQKVLLINEMLDGPTLGGDEDAILDLLELSDIAALRLMFGAGRLNVKQLESDLDGDSSKRLKRFFAARFKGGRDALLNGDVEPQGDPGKGAPTFAYDWSQLKMKLARATSVAELDTFAAEVFALDPAAREKALHEIGVERDTYDKKITDLEEQAANESDPAKQHDFKIKIDAITALRRIRDRILQQVFRDVALTTSAADLAAKTVAPDPARKADILTALKPDVKVDSSGVALPFDIARAAEYEKDLRDLLPKMVQAYYDKVVKDKGPVEHADKSKVHPLDEFERIGNASKDETDRVFGQYYDKSKKPELKADVPGTRGNIHDLFADTENELKGMDKTQKHDKARNLMLYFFQANRQVRALNHSFNASPSFHPARKPLNDEATILDKLADEFTDTDAKVDKLNEIDRGWVASAGGGEINIQIFKKDTPDKDRDFLWDMFQTLIHEYIHTLRDDKYDAFADTFGDGPENNTLIEGVDSLLDEIVWENVAPRVNDPKLRKIVEGPANAKLPPIDVKPASRRRYASYAEAVKLVNIVGIRNLYAAYFQGDIKKIGG